VVTKEQYDHARQAVELAQAQVKVSQAQEANARAQLEVVRTQLQNTEIVSPAGGVIARKWVMPGDIVQPGQPVYTIYDLRDLWVTAYFEETKLFAIRLGSPVEISVTAYPGRKLVGKVVLIGAAAASEFSLIPGQHASGNFTKVTQRVRSRSNCKTRRRRHRRPAAARARARPSGSFRDVRRRQDPGPSGAMRSQVDLDLALPAGNVRPW